MKNRFKNKVYFFHPYSGQGGADLSISRLINGIDTKKYDIELITLNKPKIKAKIDNKVKYLQLNVNRTFLAYKLINKHIELDKKYPRKIFISNQNFANSLSSILLDKRDDLKLVLFERNHINELDSYFSITDFIKKNIIKFLIKFFYKRADLVLTNSKESSLDLKNFSSCKIKTLYNPCFFKLYKQNRKKTSKKLVILNVSRFSNQKDHITLLKGFNNSKYKNKFVLKLVGYGENEEKIKKFIKDHKLRNVKILKNIFNQKLIYDNSDLFILTSLYEGFPNVLVEAASYRIPIISSNFKSGCKEILLNGKAGTIFELKDHKKLSKLIDRFYYDRSFFQKKEFICAKNLKRFSNDKILNDFNKILSNV